MNVEKRNSGILKINERTKMEDMITWKMEHVMNEACPPSLFPFYEVMLFRAV